MQRGAAYIETAQVTLTLAKRDGYTTTAQDGSYFAGVVCDSLHPNGSRLTTIVATYPRFVHSELMTHRLFSRNASSSRALPVKKMIEAVIMNGAQPYSWGSNKPGMQAGEELRGKDKTDAVIEWNRARWAAITHAQEMVKTNAHKQIVNRILEPYAWITTVISATNWENFFHQRCTEFADPTLRHIAEMIFAVYDANVPAQLEIGERHLPFLEHASDREAIQKVIEPEQWPNIAVARCARVSYLNHNGTRDPQTDIEMTRKLANDGHWSPFEHVATTIQDDRVVDDSTLSGNFAPGWVQYRKMFEDECFY